MPRESIGPRFEHLEPRLLLSADAGLVPLESPRDYGGFLFNQSLFAESIAFESNQGGSDGDSLRAPFASTSAMLRGSDEAGDPFASMRPISHEGGSEGAAGATRGADLAREYIDRISRRQDPISELNGSLARTGRAPGDLGASHNADAEEIPAGPLPDLEIVNAFAPTEAERGETITVDWSVRNRGEGDVQGFGWHDSVVFSYDDTLDHNDRTLTNRWMRQHADLPAGASYEFSRSVTLPDNLADSGYLLFVVDRFSHLQEADAGNNVLAVPITITNRPETPQGQSGSGAGGAESLPSALNASDLLTQEQAQSLLEGFEGFAEWAAELSEFEDFASEIPLVAEIAGPDIESFTLASLFSSIDPSFISLGEFFQDRLVDPIVGTLQSLADGADVDVTIQDFLDSIGGGALSLEDKSASEITFGLNFSVDEMITSLALDLGDAGVAANIDLGGMVSADINLDASLNFNLQFGVDSSEDLAAGDRFFITPGANSLTLDASLSADTLDIEGRVGFAHVAVDIDHPEGALELNAGAEVSFNDPSPGSPDRITIAEIRGTSLESLLSVVFSGGYQADLNAVAEVEGSPLGASGRIIVGASEMGNPFSSPDVDLSEIDLLSGFRNLSAQDFLGLLSDFAAWLQALGDSGALDLPIPFTGGAETLGAPMDVDPEDDPGGDAESAVASTVGELLRLGDGFRDQFLGILTLGQGFDEGAPIFSTVDDLVALLNDIVADMGDPLLSSLMFDFDPGDLALTFTVDPTLEFSEVVPFEFGFNVDPLAAVSGEGEIVISGDIGVDLTFGVLLTPIGVDEMGNPITFDSSSLLSEINGGAGVEIVDGVDFTVTPRDLVPFDVDLDPSMTTFADLFQAVNNAAGNDGRVALEFNDENNALVLRETDEVDPMFVEGEDDPMLRVTPAQVESDDPALQAADILRSAPLAIQLGLVASANTINGPKNTRIHRIVGNPLHGDSIADKFFLENAGVSANLSVGASGLTASAELAILEVGITDSSVTGDFGFGFMLNASGDDGGRVSLPDLLNRVGNPLGLDRTFTNDEGEEEVVPAEFDSLVAIDDGMGGLITEFTGFGDFISQAFSGSLSAELRITSIEPAILDIFTVLGVTPEDGIAITVGVPDITSPTDINVDDGGLSGQVSSLIADFRNLNPEIIIDMFLTFLDYVDTLTGSNEDALARGFNGVPFINEEIPLIDLSIADVLGFVGQLRDQLTMLRQQADMALAELESTLEGFLTDLPFVVQMDDPDDPAVRAPDVRFGYEEGLFTAGLDLSLAFIDQPFNLDLDLQQLLETAGLGDAPEFLTDLVDFQSSGSLDFTAGVNLSVNFGLDLAELVPGDDDGVNVQDAFFFFAEPDPAMPPEEGDPLPRQTRIEFFTRIVGDPLNFNATLGPIMGSIMGGRATLASRDSVEAIQMGDDPDTIDPATISIGLVDAPEMGESEADGRVPFLSVFDAIDFEIDAAAELNLPVMAGSLDLGALNVFVPDFTDFAGPNEPQVMFPDIEMALNNLSLLDQIEIIVDGVDLLLGGVQDIFNGQIGGLSLPFIGDNLGAAADFIAGIRSDVIMPLQDFLETVNEEALSLLNELQQNFFMIFSNVGLLLPADGRGVPDGPTPRGDVSPSDVGLFVRFEDPGTGELTEFSLEQLNDMAPEDLPDITTARELRFDLRLGIEFELETMFDFDIGVPGLALDFDTDVAVTLGFEWNLAFGLNFDQGFFFDVTTDQDLFTGLELSIMPGMADPDFPDRLATATIGILKASAFTREGEDNGASVGFSINLRSPTGPITDPLTGEDRELLTFQSLAQRSNTGPNTTGNNAQMGMTGAGGMGGMMTPSSDGQTPSEDSSIFEFEVGFAAQLNLFLAAGLDLSIFGVSPADLQKFPGLETDFDFDWELSIGTADRLLRGPGMSGFPQPNVEFSEVNLVVGEFVTEFIQPIVEEINEAIEPLRPVVDILTARLPVISDLAGSDITLVDLSQIFSTLDPRLASLRFIGAAVEIFEIVDDFVMLIDSIDEDGRIALGEFTALFNEGQEAFRPPDRSDSGNFEMPSIPTEDQFMNSGGGALLNSTRSVNFDLAFPLLSDPFAAFGLLTGDADVTLFTFDTELKFGFFYSQFFSIVGPLGARFSGSINADILFGVGFDGAGLPQAIETVQRAIAGEVNFAAVASAIGNAILDGFFISDNIVDGEDLPEVKVYGEITAAVAVNVVVAEGGVRGGIAATINIDLSDVNEDGDLVRTADGKLRIKEIIYIVSRTGNPFCIFNLSGKVDAFLDAYIAVGPCPFCVEYSYEFARVTLISFSIACEFPTVFLAEQGDDLGDSDDGAGEAPFGTNNDVLYLNIGDRSDRRNGFDDEVDEEFTVRQSGSGSNQIIFVSGFGEEQQFGPGVSQYNPDDGLFKSADAITRIVARGGNGDDIITFDSTVTVDVVALGGPGNDIITGGAGRNIIFGGAGDDTIVGGSQRDILAGGDGFNIGSGADAYADFEDADLFSRSFPLSALLNTADGNDTIFGQEGNDLIYGQRGDDTIRGGPGNDVIYGNDGADTLFGDQGADTIFGGLGDDYIEGGRGADRLYGDLEDPNSPLGGDDTINGGDGDDMIWGGAGNDVLRGENGADTIWGGAGNDTIEEYFIPEGLTIDDLDDGAPDTVFGEGGDDVIRTYGGDDLIYGGDGNDRIWGGKGDDRIYGGELDDPSTDGDDLIFGEDGDDLIYGDAGNDIIRGGAGDDEIYGDSEFEDPLSFTTPRGANPGDIIFGGDGEDLIFGSVRDDRIFGGGGDDRIYAGSGDDLVIGGLGDDQIYAGAGDDEVRGREGNDIIFGEDGNDLIFGDMGDDLIYGGAGDDELRGGMGRDEIRGGDGNDEIFGNEGDDLLLGGAGDDIIKGNTGADVIRGGDGNDKIFGNEGNDLLYGDAGDDEIFGGIGDDTIFAGRGDDTVFGEDGDDIIYGDDGNDHLYGGLGEDQLYGGRGIDTLYGGDGADLLVAGEGLGNRLFGGAGNDTIFGADVTAAVESGFTDPDFDFPAYAAKLFIDDPTMLGTVFGDLIVGGDGDDIIYTLGGADYVEGGDGADFIYAGEGVGDAIFGGRGEDVIYGSHTGNDFIDAGDDDDFVHGQGGEDVIYGGDGDDELDGGADADMIFGEDGDDVIRGGGGDGDLLYGGRGDDLIYGSDDGGDIIFGGEGNDRVFGQGGNDFIHGGPGNDMLHGGAGDDIVYGGSDSDLIIGGAGHDRLYGYIAFDPNDDGANDIIYGDSGTGLPSDTDGRDRIFGGAGSDQLFGEGDDDYIDPGPGRDDLVDYGSGEGPIESDFIPPFPTPNATPQDQEAIDFAPFAATAGASGAGLRWAAFFGSADGQGVSGDSNLSLDADIFASGDTQHLVWADSRSGSFQIYYLRRTGAGVFEPLGESASGGGVSDTLNSARRPSVTIDQTGAPIMAWTEIGPGGAGEIVAARWNGSEWVALGAPFETGGVSDTGGADFVKLINTDNGPVAAWIDRSAGAANVFAKRFDGANWVALGAGSASGNGLSDSTNDVSGLNLATDGQNIAASWTALGVSGDAAQVFLREWNGAAWTEIDGSGAGEGVSDTVGESVQSSVAYHQGSLYVAWADASPGTMEIYARRTSGGVFVEAGMNAASLGGLSRPGLTDPRVDPTVPGGPTIPNFAQALRPQLASSGDRLTLMWLSDNIGDRADGTTSLYTLEWTGSEFVEVLDGDARGQGVSETGGNGRDLAFTAGDSGVYAAWVDSSGGSPEIFVRGDEFVLTSVETATDDASLQALLDAATPGAAIVLESGFYSANLAINTPDVMLLGESSGSVVLTGEVAIGAPNVHIRNIEVHGGVSVDDAAGAVIRDSRFESTGLTITNSPGASVLSSVFESVSGAAVTVSGASDGFAMRGVTINGAESGVVIESAIQDLRIVRVSMENLGVGAGIDLAASAAGLVQDNFITTGAAMRGGESIGIYVRGDFGGQIVGNEISGFDIGLVYDGPAVIGANVIRDSDIGVRASVEGEGGFGFVGASEANEIVGNRIGVLLEDGWIRGQIIRGSAELGVTGSGAIGPVQGFDQVDLSVGETPLDDRPLGPVNLIVDNAVGVGEFEGLIRFNRFENNGVGVDATERQTIHNNLLIDDGVAIHVSAADRVAIANNTVVNTAGTGVLIDGGASETELRNNILVAPAGPALIVAPGSTAGFFADFNAYASPDGQPFIDFAGAMFDDLTAWRAASGFDINSIGRTLLTPTLDDPNFLWAARSVFDVALAGAGRRFDSPTVDSADPLSDIGVAPGRANLITNSSFASGLAGWTTGAGATAGAAGFTDDSSFSSPSNPEGFIEQTIDLLGAGFTEAELDSRDLVAIFGARFRSAFAGLPDGASISITFLTEPMGVINPQPVDLGSFVARSGGVSDRWELTGDRVTIPTGARTAVIRVETMRESGPTTDVRIDDVFLYIESETRAADIGAYGGTDSELAADNGARIRLRKPDTSFDLNSNSFYTIRWDTFGNAEDLPVRIDAYQLGVEGPEFLMNLVEAAPDTGAFEIIPVLLGLEPGADDIIFQVSLVGSGGVIDRSDEPVNIIDPVAPIIEEVVVNGGAQQRSNIERIDIVFSEKTNVGDLVETGAITEHVQLLNVDTGEIALDLSAARFAYNANDLRLTIDLSSDGLGGSAATALEDGAYELFIDSSAIVDALGNTLGGEGRSLAIASVTQQAGDANGDGVVNALDLAAILGAWNRTDFGGLSIGDLNGDHVVDAFDLSAVLGGWTASESERQMLTHLLSDRETPLWTLNALPTIEPIDRAVLR